MPRNHNPSRIRLTEYLWLILAALIPLLFLPHAASPFALPKALGLRLGVLLLGASTLHTVLHTPRAPLPRAKQAALVLIAVTAILISLSSLLSDAPQVSLWGSYARQDGLITRLSYLVLAACVLVGLQTRAQMDRLVLVLVWGSLPVVALGLSQAAGWLHFGLVSDAASPVMASLGRSNFFGSYLVLLIPLTGQMALQGQHKLRRTALVLLCLAQCVCLVLTRARAALLGLGCAVLVLALLQIHLRRVRRVVLLAALAAGAAGAVLLLPRSASWDARLVIWHTTLPLIARHPLLGHGFETLRVAFIRVFPPELVYYQGRTVYIDRAHNLLFDTLFSAGLLGTAAYAALWFSMLKRIRNYLAQTPLAQPWYTGAIIAVLAGHALELCFQFETMGTGVIVWLLWALLLSLPFIEESLPEAQPGARWSQALLTGGALALAGVLVLRPLMAELAYSRANDPTYSQAARLASARKAVRLWPAEPVYWLALAEQQAEEWDIGAMQTSLAQAQALLPGDPHVEAVRGDLLFQLARRGAVDVDDAVSAYQQSVQIAPNVAAYHLVLGIAQMAAGDYGAARATLERAAALDITDPRVHAQLALVYGALNMQQEAVLAGEAARYWLDRTGGE